MRRRQRVMLALYLAVVAYGVFGPSPGDEVLSAGDRLRDLGSEVQERVGTVDPSTPTTQPRDPLRADLVAGLTTEEFLNVLLLVPFGLLFPAAWPRLRWVTVPIGMGLSAAVELIQGQFLSWRSESIQDVRFNALGVLAGFALWLAFDLVVRRGRRSAQPSGNIPRRGSSV